MKIDISWSKDFEQFMTYLNLKYGDKMFDIDGIGKQLDLNDFSKNFFKAQTTADASVDSNSNVVARTGIEYKFEMSKPLGRYNSYWMLYKQLKKLFGKDRACKIIEAQLCGDIYINDFTDVCSPLIKQCGDLIILN